VKVLITTDFYLPHITGVTTVVVNEQKMLAQMGIDVRVLTIQRGPTSLYKNGVYYMHGSHLQVLRDSQLAFSYHDPLFHEILSWKPDIIHSNNEFFTMGWARRIAKKLNIPLIHTCHTDFTRFDTEHKIRESLWDHAMAMIIRRRVRYADTLISPSIPHSQMIRRYKVTQPIEVIPSGIDLLRFQHREGENNRKALRSSLGFTENDCVLVSVCRLASEKRVDQSIDEFFLLSLLEPSARLLLVGAGPKEEHLKKQVKSLALEDLVVFAGGIPTSEVHQYYQASDIFISSSIRESQGLGFVEAMASGLPVLLREDHSLGLSVEDFGCGKICPDQRSFVAAASELVSDVKMRKEMSEHSLLASERFSLQQWAEALLLTFEAVLDKSHKHND